MTLDSLKESVAVDPEPPEELPALLRALWCARKGRWHEAHDLVQEESTTMAAWIHAHLHLIEGDLSNAAYWYRQAGRPSVTDRSGLEEEWETIAARVIAAQAR